MICSGLNSAARRCTTSSSNVSGMIFKDRPPTNSRNVQEPQRRGPLGDVLGAHDGLGLELDVDRAAAGEVGGGDEETPLAVDGELDADRAPGREVEGEVQGRGSDVLAVVGGGAVALAGHDADIDPRLVGGVGAEVGAVLERDL